MKPWIEYPLGFLLIFYGIIILTVEGIVKVAVKICQKPVSLILAIICLFLLFEVYEMKKQINNCECTVNQGEER